MRLGSFCFHKPSLKLFLACSFTFVVTLYWFWDGCEKYTGLPATKSEETRGLPLSAEDCIRLISKTSSEDDEGNGKFELDKATDQKVCANKHSQNRITVKVNGDKTVEGRLDVDEVFVPFSFVKDYFEIYGEIQEVDGKKVLDWRHSYSEIHSINTDVVYEPKAPFLWFEKYHVEGRTRMKCISGIEEVPVSSQWNEKGHFYPIQIAQYGISHYNMLQLEDETEGNEKLFEDAESASEMNWNLASKTAQVANVFDKEKNSNVIQFSTTDLTGKGISLGLDSATKHFILIFDLQLRGEVRVSVIVETQNSDYHTVHFTSDREMISCVGSNVYYGIGRWRGWRRVVRDLDTDLRKGLLSAEKKYSKKSKLHKLFITEIQSIILHGEGSIDNISLSRTAHEHSFMAASNWLLRSQDELGGWPITVTRKVIDGVALYPGWHSAMAQGQAMSLLTRAYLYTRNEAYLKAALKATKLFKVKSKEKGVLAVFMNQFHWYEEYPTTPSLFVLNGFIYSLLGLYDLKLTAAPEDAVEPAELFDEGMRSLKVMLPLYDSGSGTFYDLRHVTMRIAPNMARWDYHSLHVSLLRFLATLDSDPIFKATALRWEGYTKGKRAKHN